EDDDHGSDQSLHDIGEHGRLAQEFHGVARCDPMKLPIGPRKADTQGSLVLLPANQVGIWHCTLQLAAGHVEKARVDCMKRWLEEEGHDVGIFMEDFLK